MNAEIIPVVITVIFLCVILSYYVLLFIPRKSGKKEVIFDSLSVIIPAHNEEKYIVECIDSVIDAEFEGRKDIIVVDDGSIDRTADLITNNDIILIKQKHMGKSASINNALKIAKGELIAVVDADSVIAKNALKELSNILCEVNVAGGTGIVKVKNRRYVNLWTSIEQIYNSLMRSILSKVNANVTTPGPLSMYRSSALAQIGGFSTHGFSEDVDITIRLIRNGYKIGFTEKAVAMTNLPHDPRGFFRQRTRFARGMLNIFKKHIRMNTAIIDFYTLPILLFTYVQAVIMGSFTLYQIVSGYFKYFSGVWFSTEVIKFFFEWFSIIGFVRWGFSILSGATPLTVGAAVGILSTLLSYPLYFYAIFKYDRFDYGHLLALFFMAPFWWLIMFIYIACLPEILMKKQYNKWKKNE